MATVHHTAPTPRFPSSNDCSASSCAVRDLALRGAEAIREDRDRRREAIEFRQRLDSGEDDGYDWSVSERLHAERR